MTERIHVTVTVDTDELREWADRHADMGNHGVAHVLYAAAKNGETLTEQAIREAEKRGAVDALRSAADDMRPIWWGDGDNGFYGALMHEPHPELGPPHIRRVPVNDWLRDRADRLDAQEGTPS